MKYLFIGLGSIGMRHLQNLRSLTDEPIYALRTKIDKEVDKKYNITSALINSIPEEFIKPDVVFITNPTSKHLHYAMMFCDSHLFIEKPILTNSSGIKELLKHMEQNNKVCFVGYNYRFHPQVIHIKKLLKEDKIGKILYANIQSGQYLPDWHPNEDYRKSFASRKELGGGALLTMSHDIDYAYWLFGQQKVVYSNLEKKSDLDINVEDTVDIVTKTTDRIIIKIHMDYLQKEPSRTIEIVGTEGRITWDYYENKLVVHTNKTMQSIDVVNFERNDMFVDELKYFLKCIKDKEKPKITHDDIKAVMEIIDNVKKENCISDRDTS